MTDQNKTFNSVSAGANAVNPANNDKNDDLSKLRDVVLKWVDAKPPVKLKKKSIIKPSNKKRPLSTKLSLSADQQSSIPDKRKTKQIKTPVKSEFPKIKRLLKVKSKKTAPLVGKKRVKNQKNKVLIKVAPSANLNVPEIKTKPIKNSANQTIKIPPAKTELPTGLKVPDLKISVKPIINQKKITPLKATVPIIPKTLGFKKLKTKQIKTPIRSAPPKGRIPTKTKADWPKKIPKLINLSIAIIVVIIIGFGALLNIFKWRNSAIEKISGIIPYPIALVNLKPLYYHQWQTQSDSLLNFYKKERLENNELEIPDLAEIEKHIFSRMIGQEILKQLAKDYNISITNDEINQQIQALVAEMGSREILNEQLSNLYDWTLDEFKEELLVPLILKNKVSVAITLDDRINQDARLKAEEILSKIRSGEKTFEELALAESEDITSLQAGDLGYFGRGQMIPAFEEAAFNLEPGEISDIVKTKFGFHIIKLEEKLRNEKDEIEQVRARHILIRSKNLDDYLAELKEKALIWQFIRI